MRPCRVAQSNVVYKGPSPDIGDLWCERIRPGEIRTVWELTDEERITLLKGGRIVLTIMGEPISPVHLRVGSEEETHPIAQHGWKIDKEPGDKLNQWPEDEEDKPSTPEEDKLNYRAVISGLHPDWTEAQIDQEVDQVSNG